MNEANCNDITYMSEYFQKKKKKVAKYGGIETQIHTQIHTAESTVHTQQ